MKAIPNAKKLSIAIKEATLEEAIALVEHYRREVEKKIIGRFWKSTGEKK